VLNLRISRTGLHIYLRSDGLTDAVWSVSGRKSLYSYA